MASFESMVSTKLPTTYLFRMDRWTPDSLPAKRMAEYMAKLALLFGAPDSVHFSKLRSGSATQFFNVDLAGAQQVWTRLNASNGPMAEPELAAVRRDINKMLMEDGQVGYVKAEPGPKLLEFLGRKTPIADEVSVHQTGSIDGIVIRVGGRGESVHQQGVSQGMGGVRVGSVGCEFSANNPYIMQTYILTKHADCG